MTSAREDGPCRRGWLRVAGPVLLVAAVLGSGAQEVETTPEPEDVPEVAPRLSDESGLEPYLALFAEVLARVKQHHYDDPPVDELMEGAIRGMLSTLDPYSQYYDVESYKELKTDTRGKFGGLGISFGMKNNRLTVIAAIEDTPAFRVDIEAGDVISEMNGESTAPMSAAEAARVMRGEPGTEVTLTLLREGVDEPIVHTITRDVITIVSVKHRRLQDDVGYIRITGFMEPTAEAVGEALSELLSADVQALILDLRSNPGGLLSSAVEVASYFLDDEDLVVYTQGGAEPESLMATATTPHTDLPLVVLVNRGSASASEIVAGAIRAHHRGLLIGAGTFGKASVQKIYTLEEGVDSSAVRLTIAHYYTPDGIDIHEVGIDPDVRLAPLGPLEGRMWRRVRDSDALKEFLADEGDDVLARLKALDHDDTTSPLRRRYSTFIDALENDGLVLNESLIKYAIAFETLNDLDEYEYDPQIRTAIQYLEAFETFRHLRVGGGSEPEGRLPRALPDGDGIVTGTAASG